MKNIFFKDHNLFVKINLRNLKLSKTGSAILLHVTKNCTNVWFKVKGFFYENSRPSLIFLSHSLLSIYFISGSFMTFSREFETVHWKYRNITCLIKSYMYATHNIYTYMTLAASYYWHSRRRSYLVIAYGIAMRMWNRRGLFREHAFFAEPKVAFYSRLQRCSGRRVATRVKYEAIIQHGVKRKKRILRGDGNAKRASRAYAILGRATTDYVFLSRADLGWSVLLLYLFLIFP